ncbi:M28 family peptidase [Roseisolibacter agri]|uniref:Peptidase M28 domain-containing protein n=1 Tax=Roseisolibacter agri TaxID=2014610 RepID=A0AA37Q0H4_9BACT|nr:M28 family peptidase [Roseisolibacter agri]GLC24259.1 hypothetical protein rosag_07720 [Roseisolibacter agri]
MPLSFRHALAALPLCALPLAAQAPATPRVTKDAPARSAQAELPLKHAPRPTTAAITPADLMTRVYLYADDSLMGRQVGSVHNDRATDYIAGELRRLGLEPAGENGTYFQSAVERRALVAGSAFGAEGAPLTLGSDFVPRDPIAAIRPFDGLPIVYAGTWGDAALLAGDAVAGKVVVVSTPLDAAGRPTWNNLRIPIVQRFANAAAIAVAGLDGIPPAFTAQLMEPAVGVRGMAAGPRPSANAQPAFVWVTRDAAATLLGTPLAGATPGAQGRIARGSIAFETQPAPGRNVVAILRGSDPVLRNTFVAIGAHNDHVGFDHEPVDHDSLRTVLTVTRPGGADSPERPVTAEEATRIRRMIDSLRALRPARQDSIYNGADDDGSGSMALLEIAESVAAARVKPKRSLLFVWHTGEEAGLFGAQYFTDHPTVSRDSIVAQLNVDMIGRGSASDLQEGGPAYVQLIGSKRLSTELGALVESVGSAARPTPFRFDYTYDANGHPEQYYCRSDHYMYARYGIPVVFFSTGGHRDYHMVTDEPQYLDYPKYAAVTQLIHDVALRVASLDHRPALSAPKPDPRGQCVQ